MTSIAERRVFWVLGIIIFWIFLYLVSDILLPFVVGMFVAYFLDPVADRLEEAGLSRTSSTVTILISFFILVIFLVILLVPMLADQLLVLASKIPLYIQHIIDTIRPKISGMLGTLDSTAMIKVEEAASDLSSHLLKFVGDILSNIWKSGVAFLNLISLILITPIVAFYLLRDWDRITTKVDSWLPRKNAKTIRKLLKEIDVTLAGFIRGQASVCILLGVFYATGLLFVGLDYALLIGFSTGLLCIIPYVGLMFGMSIGLGVAFFQFGDFASIVTVVAIFAIGQMIEGNFITPKLVGDKVGLHPVWIIFGMLAGAALFGFVGILLAVPVTAIIGVLSRYGIEQYLKSPLYLASNRKQTRKRKAKA